MPPVRLAMKIRHQFRLLIFGIVIIPVFAFVVDVIHLQYITKLTILLFSVIMSLFIVRSITRSIALLENATQRIVNGELDLEVDVKGSNEISSLSNSLNKMRNALREEEKRRYFFIMGITHDLKTPLALIRINAEAVEDGVINKIEEQKHSMNIIMNKVDELEGMINDLIDFIRVGSSEVTQKKLRMTNLRSFLSVYIDRVATDGELLRHKVESTINLPASLSVKMDSSLIQRALDNIVSNSFRYTPKGSRLFINTDFDGQAVTLTISDNGKGIPEKDLPYIFDLFYRGSSSRKEQGMGMGLTVAKSIIDSHGWSLSASSNTDKGACFTVTIPV